MVHHHTTTVTYSIGTFIPRLSTPVYLVDNRGLYFIHSPAKIPLYELVVHISADRFHAELIYYFFYYLCYQYMSATYHTRSFKCFNGGHWKER